MANDLRPKGRLGEAGDYSQEVHGQLTSLNSEVGKMLDRCMSILRSS